MEHVKTQLDAAKEREEMTDKKQPEALRLADEAWNFDCSEYRGVRSANAAMMGKLQDCADMIRKLHTENTALQQGYAAARLEIESLQARIKAMAEEHADELMVAHLDGRMRSAQIMPESIRSILVRCRNFIDTTKVPAYPAGADLADEIDNVLRAAQPAGAQQPGDCGNTPYDEGPFTLAQQPGAATWTPLPGTLPEPGTPVLLDIGKKYPIRAMWAAKHTLEVGMEDDSGFGEYDEATDTYYCPDGWYEWNEHEEIHWAVDKTPTAWCKLPPNGGASHGQAPAQAAEGCTRSHPHENMDSACRAKAAIAEMQNMAARGAEATAHDLERFVAMLAAAPTTQAREIERLRQDAARYRWLRHGDNDEKVLKTYTSRPSEPGEPTMFLPRNGELDRLIDAARAAQETHEP